MTDTPKTTPDEQPTEQRDEENVESAAPPSAVTTRERRRWRSSSERRKLLKDQTFRSVADAIKRPVIMVFHSDEVEGGDGRPRTVRDFLGEVVDMVEATGEAYRLQPVGFQSSVVFELQPIVPPVLQREIDARIADDPEATPTDQELDLLIPESVAAGAAIATILAMPPEEAYEAALEYRPAMARAYSSLARTLVREHATLEVEAAGDITAEIDTETAKEAEDLAENPKAEEPLTIYVRGVLTVADSTGARFRVTIDDEVRPPELHGRTRAIDGPYNEQSKQAVEREGLWNKRVVAEVLVLRERRRDSRHARVSGYAFQAIRPFATPIDAADEPEWARRMRAPVEEATAGDGSAPSGAGEADET